MASECNFSLLKPISLCHTKFSFVKNGGGAFLLLLLSVSLLIAQSPGSQSCNDWVVEICESPLPPGSIGGGCTDVDDCRPVYFYFYLKSTGSVGSGTPVTFSFRQFNFVGHLNVTPNILATTKVLSVPNEAQSLGCSPSEINQPNDPASPTYSVSANGDFSYQVINNNDLDINWAFTDRKLLFVVAVDAFPGEIVTLGGLAWSFTFPNGVVCNNTQLITFCNPGGGPLGKQVAVPDICGFPLLLRFATPIDDPVLGHPKRKKVPVIVTSSDVAPTVYNLESLDFLVRMAATQPMGSYMIEGGKIPSNAILFYDETSGLDKRIYAKANSLQVAASTSTVPVIGNTLFYIVMDGPELESDCSTVDLIFTPYRRMVLAGVCCQPRTGNSGQVTWDAGDCPGYCPRTTLSIAEASNFLPPAVYCNDILLDVLIGATLAQKIYDEAGFSIIIEHSGTLSWSSAKSSSNYCGNMPFCVTTTAMPTGSLRLDFSIDGTANVVVSSALGPIQLARLGFTATNCCISAVTFVDGLLHEIGAAKYCLPSTASSILKGSNADDVCSKSLVMKYTVFDGTKMKDIEYTASVGACSVHGLAAAYGSESIRPCSLPGTQTLVPFKDDNPLNGLTTYDLVLISKHILGIEPLGSPYKLIAADAKKDNTVQTSDIVELRKLILGIYQELPDNTSWRFVPKSYVFPNPQNPFQTMFPESVDFTVPPNDQTIEFYGIKVGDVNQTVATRPEGHSPQTRSMGYGLVGGAVGEVVEVPIFARQDMEQVAWQMSLRYDVGKAKLVGLSWADAAGEYQAQGWHEPVPGTVNALWYDGEGKASSFGSGNPLFYLKFELKADAPSLGLALSSDTTQNIAYSVDGVEIPLLIEAAQLSEFRQAPIAVELPIAQAWGAGIYPNPSSGHFRLELQLPSPADVTVSILDLFGRKLWQSAASMAEGYNSFTPELGKGMAPGQYFVQFESAYGRKTLRLVKI